MDSTMRVPPSSSASVRASSSSSRIVVASSSSAPCGTAHEVAPAGAVRDDRDLGAVDGREGVQHADPGEGDPADINHGADSSVSSARAPVYPRRISRPSRCRAPRAARGRPTASSGCSWLRALGGDPLQVVRRPRAPIACLVPAEHPAHELRGDRRGGDAAVPRLDRDAGAAGEHVVEVQRALVRSPRRRPRRRGSRRRRAAARRAPASARIRSSSSSVIDAVAVQQVLDAHLVHAERARDLAALVPRGLVALGAEQRRCPRSSTAERVRPVASAASSIASFAMIR